MKEYIITEEELRKFYAKTWQGQSFDDFLKSKKPVKQFSRNEVEKIIWDIIGIASSNKLIIRNIEKLSQQIASDIKSKFKLVAEGVVGQEDIGGKLNVGDYLEHDIIFKILEYDGKKVRIWIEAIDE